jgi:hypothetical protein
MTRFGILYGLAQPIVSQRSLAVAGKKDWTAPNNRGERADGDMKEREASILKSSPAKIPRNGFPTDTGKETGMLTAESFDPAAAVDEYRKASPIGRLSQSRLAKVTATQSPAHNRADRSADRS